MSDPKRARCLDPNWKYTKGESTDLAKTFARVRRQMKEAEAQQPANVKPIRPTKAKS